MFFLWSSQVVSGQEELHGYWVGMITEGSEQFKFEINIGSGDRSDPVILRCRSCQKLKGDIIDHRETEKIIDFLGIVNKDQSINLIDTKLVFKEKYEGEVRTRYQIGIEVKKGTPWLVGYYQDYNSKGRKVRQGKIYLKREEQQLSKA